MKKIIKIISQYARNGMEAIKILQTLTNIASLEGRTEVTEEDARWVIEAGRYSAVGYDKIIDISLIKPRENI